MSAAPITGTRAWLGAGLLVIAVLSGVRSLGTLVAPGTWTAATTAAVVLLAAVTATARTVGRARLAPTLWGGGVAVVLVATLWSSPTGPRLPLPTLGTVDGLRRTAESGVTTIAESYIPMTATPGVVMLIVSGALLAFLVADLLALGLRRPGASGFALAALWSVAVVFDRSPNPLLLTLGGVTFLLLLTLVRPARASAARERTGRRSAAGAVAAVSVTVLALVTAPLVAAMPGWGTVRLPSGWGGGASQTGPVRLSLDLDMRADLGSQSDRTLLSYSTDSATDPGPLRLYTLSTFDGRQWQRSDEPTVDRRNAEGLLWPTPVEEDPDGLTTVRVQVDALDTDRLPVTLDPRTVSVPPTDWWYDPERDEVLSPSRSVSGLTYEMSVQRRDLSAATLAADTSADVGPGSPYLAVPDTPSADEVRALAQEVTADAGTAHDQAVALQSWFRDANAFHYDTRVPAARSEDAVWDFLSDRRGYCVQYATAMTVMARQLGIPARMAVGFLPGRVTADGDRVVTGQLAHTWPELWFADSGWVRFEPTPAVQTGAPPVYADPLVTDPISPEEPEAISPAPEPTDTPAPAPTDGAARPAGEVAVGGTTVPLVLVLVVAGVLVAGVLVVRLRRPERPPADAEAAWARLRRRLRRRGVTWSDAATPRAVAETLRARLEHVPAQADAALQGLAGALETERYAPDPAPTDPALMDAWIAAVDGAFDEVSDPARRGGGPNAAPCAG